MDTASWLNFRRVGNTLPICAYCANLPGLMGMDQDAELMGADLLRFLPWNEYEALLFVLTPLAPAAPPVITELTLLQRSLTPLHFHALLRATAEGEYSAMLELCSVVSGQEAAPKVFIRTFGYFDVFLEGKAIPFSHMKSKELLALLVDRQGGYLSSAEAVGYLWENENANNLTLSRCRKVAMRLRETLEQYGIEDIIETRNGCRRLVTDKVSCDLYGYLNRDGKYAQSFRGFYMSNYSWAEATLAALLRENP